MDRSSPPTPTCPRCSARVRAGDAWCSLCHGTLLPEPPPPSPVPAPHGEAPAPGQARSAVASVPLPRSELAAPGGAIDRPPVEVGTAEALAAQLASQLREEHGVPGVPWGRPWVASVVGAVVVLGALLAVMTVIGALI